MKAKKKILKQYKVLVSKNIIVEAYDKYDAEYQAELLFDPNNDWSYEVNGDIDELER
tara:strand:- start:541 stop:711 length:171 start_codon:yes stop_codon:yes gene_type:complete